MNDYAQKALRRAIEYNQALVVQQTKEAEQHEQVAARIRHDLVQIETDLRGFMQALAVS